MVKRCRHRRTVVSKLGLHSFRRRRGPSLQRGLLFLPLSNYSPVIPSLVNQYVCYVSVCSTRRLRVGGACDGTPTRVIALGPASVPRVMSIVCSLHDDYFTMHAVIAMHITTCLADERCKCALHADERHPDPSERPSSPPLDCFLCTRHSPPANP